MFLGTKFAVLSHLNSVTNKISQTQSDKSTEYNTTTLLAEIMFRSYNSSSVE